MEDKLKKLFDYQCFERNERLEKLISETESRYARGLSDEELTYVNAAGEPVTGGIINIEKPTIDADSSYGAGVGGGK